VDIILESTTKLIANKKSWKDPVKRKEIEEIRSSCRLYLRARGKVFIVMNVPEDRLDAVVNDLPAMKRPRYQNYINQIIMLWRLWLARVRSILSYKAQGPWSRGYPGNGYN